MDAFLLTLHQQEIIFTWHYIGSVSPMVNSKIQELASYLYSCGADFGASCPLLRSTSRSGMDQTFRLGVSSDPDPSLIELAYYTLFESSAGTAHSFQDNMPIPFNLVSQIGTTLSSSFLGRSTGGKGIRHRRSRILDMMTSPTSTPEIIYGESQVARTRFCGLMSGYRY